jgi:putative ABC transport system permease protein
MSVVTRGVKNAFRNGLRTSAVILILAISIGLSLSMLVANKAVEGRIADLKTQVDRTVIINPAGFKGMQGGGEPLTMDDLEKVSDVANVQTANGFMSFTLLTEGDEQSNFRIMMKGGNGKEPGKTNLVSSIEPGTLSQRFNGDNISESSTPKPPIMGIGTNGAFDPSGERLNVIEGRQLNSADEYNALVGKDLAEKNDLSIGSTFTAYDKTFTVVGIIDQGTEFDNGGVVFPLATVQALSSLENEVISIVAQADSIENLESVIAGVKETLGSDRVDVTSAQENVRQAIESLKSVQNISVVGFIASLAAAGLVVLMIMFVIVRERRREIGVLKAIGGSNRSIVSQFMVEAVVLVAMGGFIGLGTAFLGSGAIANALVSSNTSSSSTDAGTDPKFDGPGPKMAEGSSSRYNPKASFENTADLVGEVTTSIGVSTLLYGFLGMIAVALVGSALPAWLIAKVRPAEVLRGE